MPGKSTRHGIPVELRLDAVHPDSIERCLATRRGEIDRLLDARGALVLRGIGGGSAAEFARILDSLGTPGGGSDGHWAAGLPREGFGAVAGLSSRHSVPMHQDLTLAGEPAERIALYCETAAVSGGDIVIADSRAAAAGIDPELRARLEAGRPVLRVTLAGPREDSQDAPGWSRILGTRRMTEAERRARSLGWQVRWLADGAMEIRRALPALRPHPRGGEMLFCFPAHLHAPAAVLRWISRDGRTVDWLRTLAACIDAPERMDEVFLADGTPLSDEDAERLYDAFVDCETPVRLRRGDLLLLDGRLAVHGRTAFAGPRRVHGAAFLAGDAARWTAAPADALAEA